MSEPKLIAPMLSNHMIGDVISDHNGVRCYPVMENDTQNKFIVKIISVPASQSQLDALLLTGICADEQSAQQYFSSQAENIVQEASLLKKLTGTEGFVCFDNWQVAPMDDGIGYDVYLMADYRPTLERYFARNPMTHLDAVNLGLDLCAALSSCRDNGYLYIALKPGNIYLTDDGQYRIGDLGFVSLESLHFTSLPDKYRSEYTSPEISDAYATLNTTMDIYAVGLILYQAYNNGEFPTTDTDGNFAPPAYADYEMAEIILKACNSNPSDRWQTPYDLGQALMQYMQRNGVSNQPIVPAPIASEEEIATQVEEEQPLDSDPTGEEVLAEQAPQTDIITLLDNYLDDDDTVTDNSDKEEELDQLTFPLQDETLPSDEIVEDLAQTPVSEEVSEMLAQADDLIEHETPDPVQQPEPIFVEVPQPEPDKPHEEPTSAEEDSDSDELEIPEDVQDEVREDVAVAAIIDDEDDIAPPTAKPKKFNPLVVTLSVLLTLLVLAVGGLLFYENYYIQSVDNLSLLGAEDHLTVTLKTDVDNSLLTVVCTDTYGNTMRANVVNGNAHFEGLTPDTQYKVSVEISGFHKLIGTTTDRYTTVSRTDIVGFTAVTGSEDGSVILNFVVDGEQESAWRITYQAEGEEEKAQEFTGHMLNLTGLTVGKKYSFRLEPVADIYVVGNNTIEHTASKLIFAENVQILGFKDGVLSAGWECPSEVAVESWTVRCYNDSGFDQTYTVQEPKISIADLDADSAYTIDVNAAGMSQGVRAYVSAGSVTVNNVELDDSVAGKLTITWDFEGAATEAGWLVLYSVDGSEQQVIRCETNEAVIPTLIPGGKYSYTIQPPTGATVFGGTGTYTASGGEKFNRFGTTADKIRFRMCRTPKAGWNWYDLWERDFTTEFSINERASFVVAVDGNVTHTKENITMLFVIKDKAKNPVSITTRDRNWADLCDSENHGEIDIPIMPTVAGSFTMDIYFDNAYVGSQAFTVK